MTAPRTPGRRGSTLRWLTAVTVLVAVAAAGCVTGDDEPATAGAVTPTTGAQRTGTPPTATPSTGPAPAGGPRDRTVVIADTVIRFADGTTTTFRIGDGLPLAGAWPVDGDRIVFSYRDRPGVFVVPPGPDDGGVVIDPGRGLRAARVVGRTVLAVGGGEVVLHRLDDPGAEVTIGGLPGVPVGVDAGGGLLVITVEVPGGRALVARTTEGTPSWADPVPVDRPGPVAAALDPTGTGLVVVEPGSVRLVDTASGAVERTVPVTAPPDAVPGWVDTDGRWVAVTWTVGDRPVANHLVDLTDGTVVGADTPAVVILPDGPSS